MMNLIYFRFLLTYEDMLFVTPTSILTIMLVSVILGVVSFDMFE